MRASTYCNGFNMMMAFHSIRVGLKERRKLTNDHELFKILVTYRFILYSFIMYSLMCDQVHNTIVPSSGCKLYWKSTEQILYFTMFQVEILYPTLINILLSNKQSNVQQFSKYAKNTYLSKIEIQVMWTIIKVKDTMPVK